MTVFYSAPDFNTVVQAGAGSYASPATPVSGVGDQAVLYYGTGTPSNSSAMVAQKGNRLVTVELVEPGLSQLDAQTYCGGVAKLFFSA